MKKRIFYTELAYIAGLIVLAFGTAFRERADFGVSMVVAPAYILHLKISEFLPFFTFGMAEYTLQAVILIFMMLILRSFKITYLISFITAVIYGLLLDSAMLIAGLVPDTSFVADIIFYIAGMFLCSMGVSLLFHTYIAPEAYELFVKEVSEKFKIDIHKFKTAYDCTSCILSIVLSFIFFGMWHFEGVKLGTVICALTNGFIISLFTKLFEKHWTFKDKFKRDRA